MAGQSGYPTVRGDGLEIIFQNDQVGGADALYSATRVSVDEPFDPPQRLELDPSFTGEVQDPDLSANGTVLVFNVAEVSSYQLYIVTRPWL